MFRKLHNLIATIRRMDTNLRDIQIRIHDVQDRVYDFMAREEKLEAELAELQAAQQNTETLIHALASKNTESNASTAVEERILAQLTDTQIRVHDVQDRCYDLLAKSNAFLIRKL